VAELGRKSGGPENFDQTAKPQSVLFLCAMNAIRSPMAERLAREHFGANLYIRSAGIRAGDPDPFTRAVLEERGIAGKEHAPLKLDDLEDSFFDLIITLSPEAHHRALEFTRSQSVEVEYWPTMDPSTIAGNRIQILEAYRQVLDMLEKRIIARFGREP
jgi:protein-tyrosine-phosphatase